MYAVIALMGVYELDLTQKLPSLARQGGVMVAVGRQRGFFHTSLVGKQADEQCDSVGLPPLIVPYLKKNIRANGVHGRVRLLTCAAAASEGVARFSFIDEERPVGVDLPLGENSRHLRSSDETD